MPKTVQIREIPDETYKELAQRAAQEQLSVPEYLRKIVERDVSRPSIRQWVERTRSRGGPVRKSDVIEGLTDIRGPWPTDAGR